MWFRDKPCVELINSQWKTRYNEYGNDLNKNLIHLSEQLVSWNKNQFGYVHKKLKSL